MRDPGLSWTPELEDRLREVTQGMHATRGGDFGNGRAMRDVADELRTRWAHRVRAVVGEPMEPGDLPDRYRAHLRQPTPPLDELLADLDGLVWWDSTPSRS
jgi:hypothetical protein